MGKMSRALTVALALIWSSAGWSYPIVVGMEGYVGLTFYGGNPYPFSVGDPISVFYVYDSEATITTPPPVPGVPENVVQVFDSTGYPYGMFGSVGSVKFAISGVTIWVENFANSLYCGATTGADRYAIRSGSGYPGSDFNVILTNCDGTAYDVSDFPMSVPPSPPTIGQYLEPGAFLGGTEENLFHLLVDGNRYGGYAVISRTYRVPEPSTLALLGLGLAGLAAARWRHASRRSSNKKEFQ